MKSQSILLKTVICGLTYLVLSFSIFFFVYIIDAFQAVFVLGAICGVIVAVVTYCENAKRTILARIIAILTIMCLRFIIRISGIPRIILLHFFRYDEFVQDTGWLSLNHVVAYNFGVMFFERLLLISFVISCVAVFSYNLGEKS